MTTFLSMGFAPESGLVESEESKRGWANLTKEEILERIQKSGEAEKAQMVEAYQIRLAKGNLTEVTPIFRETWEYLSGEKIDQGPWRFRAKSGKNWYTFIWAGGAWRYQ